jgi:uncharacterized membrane protein
MRRTFAAVAFAVLFAVTGCNKGTPGGQGATNSTEKGSLFKQGEDTFSLDVPFLSTKLKQGETKAAKIGIKRGKNFDEDVELKFEGLPTGVTIDPAAPTVKHGDSDTNITIKAANDAALGDFTIKVKGHPTKGPDATNDLKLTVQKK